MIRYFKKAIPLSILATGIMASASFADTFTLRVGSGHPSKPTAYVTNMEKVLVPNIKKRVAAETNHKVRIIEAYAGKIAKVHETLEAVEKGLLDIGSYCVCFETAKLLPWNFDYFVPFTTTNLVTSWEVKHKILKQFPELTNVSMNHINLTPVFDSLVKAMPIVEDENERFMSLANTRARLRMTSLYYFAGLNNLLVAGTGNKVEDFGVGFYTKYGDGGVDLSPIADLMKSEVYAVANYLKINKEIQSAAPTDGLWGDDRTDEDQLGASYDELEWAMIKQKEGVHSDVFSGRKKEVYEIYLKLNKANKHKMDPIPVCLIPEKLK